MQEAVWTMRSAIYRIVSLFHFSQGLTNVWAALQQPLKLHEVVQMRWFAIYHPRKKREFFFWSLILMRTWSEAAEGQRAKASTRISATRAFKLCIKLKRVKPLVLSVLKVSVVLASLQRPTRQPVYLWLQAEVVGGMDLQHQRHCWPDLLQGSRLTAGQEDQRSGATVLRLHNHRWSAGYMISSNLKCWRLKWACCISCRVCLLPVSRLQDDIRGGVLLRKRPVCGVCSALQWEMQLPGVGSCGDGLSKLRRNWQ